MSFNDRWRDDQDRYGSERHGQDRDQGQRGRSDWGQRADRFRRDEEGRTEGWRGEDAGWDRAGFEGQGRRSGGFDEGPSDGHRSRTGSSGAYGSANQSRQGWGGYGREEVGRSYGGDRDFGRGEAGPFSRGSGGQAGWPQYREGAGMGEGGSRDRRGDRDWWDRTTDEVASWFGDDDAERRRQRDSREQGEHRGRGPKGYSRSDDRVREDVCDRLTDDPLVDASEIEVSVSGSEVTLTGTVGRRDLRRRAEDLAESVSGVTHVQNNLRVASGIASQGTGGTLGMGTDTARPGSLFGSGTNSGTGGEVARTESAATKGRGNAG